MTSILDYNGDGNISLDDLYMFILDIMNTESKKKIDGADKKNNTIQTIKNIIPTDLFDKFEPMIDKAIDFIFSIAQNTKLLKHLKKSCSCLP